MGATEVEHCFPLNGSVANPGIEGVDNIMNNYRQMLPMITLAGPTMFGPILEQFMEFVLSNKNNMVYSILLLLTDGCCSDMGVTKEILVRLSLLPASVIIIGVGNHGNWDDMIELDGDDNLLKDDLGNEIHRDIVNFVELRDAKLRGNIGE